MDLASLFFYEPPKMGSSFITFFISSEMGVSMGGEGVKMVVVIRREKRFILLTSVWNLLSTHTCFKVCLAQSESLVINCFFGDKVKKKTRTHLCRKQHWNPSQFFFVFLQPKEKLNVKFLSPKKSLFLFLKCWFAGISRT